jgi:hypothetical protein
MIKINWLLVFVLVLCSACNITQPTQTVETGSFVSPLDPEPFLSPVNTPGTTPTVTPILTPTSAPTLETPVLASTTFPMPFPTPTAMNTLRCERDGVFWNCFDELLEVRFRMTSRWLTVPETYLSPGECGGFAYGYAFYRQNQLSAGGHSLDFCQPTEGSAFIGFREPWKPGFRDVDGCSLFRRAVYCESIKPNVVMAISFPESQSVCEPYADTIYHPIVQVGVNLSLERRVQGLLFTTRFLSIRLEDQLFEPLGGVDLDRTACADTTARNRFDELANSIAQAVIEGRADEETAYQLGLVREFAGSIQVNSP